MKHPTQGTGALDPEQRFTYSDYKTWPENERWELINGEAFSMSPAPRLRHQAFLVELLSQLKNWFRGKPCRAYVAPVDVFWPPSAQEEIDRIDTITQPDLLVVCDKTKLREEGVRGAPDFIIEILSPATAYKDETEKRMLHERHGVREYWIANPDTWEVLIYTLKDGTYGLPQTASLKELVPVRLFPGLELQVRPEDLT